MKVNIFGMKLWVHLFVYYISTSMYFIFILVTTFKSYVRFCGKGRRVGLLLYPKYVTVFFSQSSWFPFPEERS